MPRVLVLLASALLWSGCGYIGEPLPPALHIPQRVADLSAAERGDRIIVTFTVPTQTTDALAIGSPLTMEVRVGTALAPFNLDAWLAGAKAFRGIVTDQPAMRYPVPAAEWVGQTVIVAVKVFGSNGRSAGWSSLFTLSVIPPLAVPSGVEVKAVPEGVRLNWQGSAPHYRVFRRTAQESSAAALGETDNSEYQDTATTYGATYYYSVEAFRSDGDIHALSERTADASITPVDTFPPPVPSGLAAVVSAGSIELAWDRSTAPDLAGYRIYRAQASGPFEKIAEIRDPSFSDRKIEAGKTYRYAVSAFDQLGNESAMSAPVEGTAQP